MAIPLVDTYIERFTPHVLSAREMVMAYAERVMARLDAIEVAIRDAEFQDEIERSRAVIPQGVHVELAIVPLGVDWELDVVTNIGGFRVEISDGIQTIWLAQPNSSDCGIGVIVRGGTRLECYSETAATTPVSLFVQWRASEPHMKHRKAYLGGLQNPIPDGNDGDIEVDRHLAINQNAGNNF